MFPLNASTPEIFIGDEGIRTPDPLLARQVLSQLSYTPISVIDLFTNRRCGFAAHILRSRIRIVVDNTAWLLATKMHMGLRRLELPTSRLSGVRSNRLSYKPIFWRPPALPHRLQCSTIGRLGLNHRVRDGNGCCP